MFNRLRGYFSLKTFIRLFILWFLLFPFDGNVLSFSIGFMTVYPYLILTFFLLAYSFLAEAAEQPGKFDKLAILFFLFWALYGLSFFPFVDGKHHAYYEIKSLVMMASTVWLLFRVKYVMGSGPFFENLHRLSVFVLVTLTFIGFFEFFTGIHFVGKFTERLWDLPAGMVTYAPVFLYDNPNNFLCYMFGVAIISFLTDFRLSEKPLKFLLIIFNLFFFSIVSDSRFGKIAVLLLFIAWLLVLVINFNLSPFRKYFWWSTIMAGSLLFCILTKPLFFGPLWANGDHYVLNAIIPVKVEDKRLRFYPNTDLVKQFGESTVTKEYWNYKVGKKMHSISIRKNLILNGLYFFTSTNFIGVGPGQYRYKHEQKQNPFPVSTVTTPHDGLIEILSQYGLPVFIPYILLFILYWIEAFRRRSRNFSYFIILTVCFILFVIISDMPSAFLNLNIGWILIPLLMLSASNLKQASE